VAEFSYILYKESKGRLLEYWGEGGMAPLAPP